MFVTSFGGGAHQPKVDCVTGKVSRPWPTFLPRNQSSRDVWNVYVDVWHAEADGTWVCWSELWWTESDSPADTARYCAEMSNICWPLRCCTSTTQFLATLTSQQTQWVCYSSYSICNYVSKCMLSDCLEWDKWVLTNFDYDRQWFVTLILPSHETAAVTVDCISRLSGPVRLILRYTTPDIYCRDRRYEWDGGISMRIYCHAQWWTEVEAMDSKCSVNKHNGD